jgi:hypothetical protein
LRKIDAAFKNEKVARPLLYNPPVAAFLNILAHRPDRGI